MAKETPARPDLCVIGAGSGGLSVAAGAVQMGASVVLIERDRMGGDCLNTGCVPSKSLIAAARTADVARRGGKGVAPSEPRIDGAGVRRHVRDVIASIAPHDSVERFEGLGCEVLLGEARFRHADEVEVPSLNARIRARRFVIATGGRPALPPIPGLAETPYLTNETIFELDAIPEHLLVVGAGPIGCELSQAWRRLGARVTTVDIGPILPKDDPELVEPVRAALRSEGVELVENAAVLRVEEGPALLVREGERERRIEGSHLLIAAGRAPNVEDLALDRGEIAYTRAGITVDRRLRTSNRRAFAIGDVAGGLQFTHLAGHHAGVVIKNALFRLPARADGAATPWATYTDPELASVGMSEADARERWGDRIEVLRWPLKEIDRARADGRSEGLIKAIVRPNGEILGCAIVGPRAGDLIHPWTLSIDRGLKIGALATSIAAYPTYSELAKRVAGAYYTPRLFSERTRKIVRFLRIFG